MFARDVERRNAIAPKRKPSTSNLGETLLVFEDPPVAPRPVRNDDSSLNGDDGAEDNAVKKKVSIKQLQTRVCV